MKECWSEGELRAYIDRELPAEEIQKVAAHLEECSECGDLWAELAGRASRVSALMHELAEPEPVGAISQMPRRSAPTWRWAGVAAALAAGVIVGIAMLPKHGTPVAVAPPTVPAVVETAAGTEPEAAVGTARNVVALGGARPVKAGSSRPMTRPRIPVVQSSNPFLALDDDPIETGVVWRVELGPREVPAEVIVDPDGRPRAIRLVNFKPNH